VWNLTFILQPVKRQGKQVEGKMDEPLNLDVSLEAAACVAADASRDLRQQAAAGKIPLEGGDLGSVLLYLCHDGDPEVSTTAIRTLRELAGERLLSVIEAPETHSYLLDILCRIHVDDTAICELIASHPAVSLETLQFLTHRGIQVASEAYETLVAITETERDDRFMGDPDEEPDDSEPMVEEEYQSKYKLAQTMGVGEKIKMALTGDKEWRGILIKDSNKLISGSIMKNPRITDAEILNIAKMTGQNEEIIRAICANKEWVKHYNIRKALVENNKTPLPYALRFMGTLSEKDVAFIAKNKNISSVISTQARRLLMNKKK
jgi:hypothetical protein